MAQLYMLFFSIILVPMTGSVHPFMVKFCAYRLGNENENHSWCRAQVYFRFKVKFPFDPNQTLDSLFLSSDDPEDNA